MKTGFVRNITIAGGSLELCAQMVVEGSCDMNVAEL